MNRGSRIDSPLQTGHFPGLVSFSRFEKTKPHFLHSAGATIRRCLDEVSDFLICSRWAGTSRSGIPTAADNSRAEHGPSRSAAMISCLTVSCIEGGVNGSLGFSFTMACRHYIVKRYE